jgi:hypothetical protein
LDNRSSGKRAPWGPFAFLRVERRGTRLQTFVRGYAPHRMGDPAGGTIAG